MQVDLNDIKIPTENALLRLPALQSYPVSAYPILYSPKNLQNLAKSSGLYRSSSFIREIILKPVFPCPAQMSDSQKASR